MWLDPNSRPRYIYIYISINDEGDRRERNRERIKSISNGTTFVALLKFSGSKKTPFRFGHRFSLDDEVHLPPSLRGWTRQARVKHHGLSTKIPLLFPYEIHLSLCAYNCIARFHMILNHPRLARVVAYVEKSFQILCCEINILVKTEKNFDKLFFFTRNTFEKNYPSALGVHTGRPSTPFQFFLLEISSIEFRRRPRCTPSIMGIMNRVGDESKELEFATNESKSEGWKIVVVTNDFSLDLVPSFPATLNGAQHARFVSGPRIRFHVF